jgi:hypothetical protein
MVYSDFDHQKQILVTRFEGDVRLKEITDYIDATRLNDSYPRKLKIITDSRKSNMLLAPEDVPFIVEANNKSLDVYTFIVDAIILTNPNDTAISFLFQQMSKRKNYFFELFADYENALLWLHNFNPEI